MFQINSFYCSNNENISRLLLACIVSTTFMIIEIIGSIFSGALALLIDAGHMLTDAGSLLFALLAIRLSEKAPNERNTFGWRRLTTLAAFMNSIGLIAITPLIIWKAIKRFWYPKPISGVAMMSIAIIGLLANLLVLWILPHNKSEHNLNIRAAYLHIVSDLFSSIGAISASLIILYTGWTPIDPILSILGSCLVLRSVWILLIESINELMEAAPKSLDVPTIHRGLRDFIPEICDVHHIHFWQVGEKPIITLHVQVIPHPDHDRLLNRIKHFLKYRYKISHSTIQVEYKGYKGSDQDCHLCL